MITPVITVTSLQTKSKVQQFDTEKLSQKWTMSEDTAKESILGVSADMMELTKTTETESFKDLQKNYHSFLKTYGLGSFKIVMMLTTCWIHLLA